MFSRNNTANLGVPLEFVEPILQFVLWIHFHLSVKPKSYCSWNFPYRKKTTETPCLLVPTLNSRWPSPEICLLVPLSWEVEKLQTKTTSGESRECALKITKKIKKGGRRISFVGLSGEVVVAVFALMLDFTVKVWTCSLLGERLLEMKDFGCSHAMDLTQLWISRTTTRDGHRTRLNYEYTNKQGQKTSIFSRGLTDFVYSR